MTSHTPTAEQTACISAATTTSSNLIISALAGAAKTSTLIMIAEALPETRILSLAFNKKIATEMQERLPANCTAMTLNSLGHRVWAECISDRVRLDIKKNFEILSTLVKSLPKPDQAEAYDNFADTLKAIEFGKSCGYIPTGQFTNAKRLMDDNEFFGHMEEAPSPQQEKLIRAATIESLKQALRGNIDFSDQILMPTVFPSMFPSYPLVLVDEAQDLSELNHAMLRKLAKKRIIAVGDENQAIYGFRGAHQESMKLLAESFKMTPLVLSTSFRCPKTVVKEALWRAPHMKAAPWAGEGVVKVLPCWDKDIIPQTAAIICRNNAPLFTMAIKLLRHGRYPQIIGNDIGKYLVKVMKKFGKETMEKSAVLTAITEWEELKLEKARTPGKVKDQSACLRIFAEQGSTLGEAIAYAEHLFSSQGPIQLMTGHKSKGLEFDTVFFLDQDLLRPDEQQERNLRYVIQTRAKQELYYVSTSDFHDEFAERCDAV